MNNQNYQYFISQNKKDDNYQIWTFDINNSTLLKKVTKDVSLTIPKGDQIIQVGNFILQWSLMNADEQYSFRLLEFNPDHDNPLGSFKDGKWTTKAVQAGTWAKKKYFGSRSDFPLRGSPRPRERRSPS